MSKQKNMRHETNKHCFWLLDVWYFGAASELIVQSMISFCLHFICGMNYFRLYVLFFFFFTEIQKWGSECFMGLCSQSGERWHFQMVMNSRDGQDGWLVIQQLFLIKSHAILCIYLYVAIIYLLLYCTSDEWTVIFKAFLASSGPRGCKPRF